MMRGPGLTMRVAVLGLLCGVSGCEQDPVELLKWTQAKVEVVDGRTSLKYVSMRETDTKLKRLDFQLTGTPIDIHAMVYTESDVSDAGLLYLGKVSRLDTLHFSDCKFVSDRGLRFMLGNNPGLVELAIVNTRVSDAAMEAVAAQQNLRQLAVSGISDVGLAHVSTLNGLQQLQLVDCTINEAGVRSLSRMQRLGRLEIFRCQILESVEQQLKRSLPGCRVIVNSL